MCEYHLLWSVLFLGDFVPLLFFLIFFPSLPPTKNPLLLLFRFSLSFTVVPVSAEGDARVITHRERERREV